MLFRMRSQIYKDSHCQVPLGLPIPLENQARHYRVAVVGKYTELPHSKAIGPFLSIDSQVTAIGHKQEDSVPFAIGDIDPNKPFVHVMDVGGLRAVLTELDTVSDFAEYLDARESFIRGKAGNTADSEWSMLARFMLSYDDDGEPQPIDYLVPGDTRLVSSEWDNEQFRLDMARRHEASIDSRIWDALIERHARMIENQAFAFTTVTSVDEGERVVRYMALENRLNRRLLGRSWLAACQITGPDMAANIRTVPHSGRDWTTYVFLNVSNFENEPEEVFRGKRRSLLQEMMWASLVDIPTSQVIIGLAADLGGPPESYDHAFSMFSRMKALSYVRTLSKCGIRSGACSNRR